MLVGLALRETLANALTHRGGETVLQRLHLLLLLFNISLEVLSVLHQFARNRTKNYYTILLQNTSSPDMQLSFALVLHQARVAQLQLLCNKSNIIAQLVHIFLLFG